MKEFPTSFFSFIIFFFVFAGIIYSSNFIKANHPYIRYFGRFDMSDKLNPRFSWPGVYICAEFTGTSIGIRLNDKTSYYNVYIDGELYKIFHGTQAGMTDYILAENLENKKHTFRLSRRNISFDEIFSFGGLILDDGAVLVEPQNQNKIKIEFIGDSFTAAESNEATEQELPWEARFPVTNIDLGFAPVTARHFEADYITTCRSGSGTVCDWQGNTNFTLPKFYDRTLMDSPLPKWDFSKWAPDLIVVALGINDFSGLKDSNGTVNNEKSNFFRNEYGKFLDSLFNLYPNVKIIAFASFNDWIRANVKIVVDEKNNSGQQNIFYAQYDYFDDGYVANGHPTVQTHKKMADQLISAIESFKIFEKH